MSTLVIGTRGSPLALAQANLVRDQLLEEHDGLDVRLRVIKTSGDQFGTISLTDGGGKGLFTKEIEDQLIAGNIHLAVHSLKDLPTQLPEGLEIGAVLAREDARDVLVSRDYPDLDQVPAGATVATSSIRRRAQLLAARPDLQTVEIRGNVETRLGKLAAQTEFAATLLAAAGLKRLGIWNARPDLHFHPLPIAVMIPAVGQGAIAVEARSEDDATLGCLEAIHHRQTAACVEAERTFLRSMGGGCQVPFAAHASLQSGVLHLVAATFSDDGTTAKRVALEGKAAAADELGRQAADRLRAS